MKNTPRSLFHPNQTKNLSWIAKKKNAEQSFICLQTELMKEKNADID